MNQEYSLQAQESDTHHTRDVTNSGDVSHSDNYVGEVHDEQHLNVSDDNTGPVKPIVIDIQEGSEMEVGLRSINIL